MINSNFGFTPLKEVWLGDCYPESYYDHLPNEIADPFKQITQWTKEDISKLQKFLEDRNIVVRRPQFDSINDYITDNDVLAKPPITPRDDYFVLGKTLYSLHNTLPKDPWRHTMNLYTAEGFDVQCPKDEVINCLHPPSIVRVGRDLFVDVETHTHVWGFVSEALINLAKKYRVNLCNTNGHSDGVFCPVSKNFIAATHYKTDYSQSFPGWEIFKIEQKFNNFEYSDKNWAIGIPGIDSNQLFNQHVATLASAWVGDFKETVFEVNMLVIDEHNVITMKEHPRLFKRLEELGITPHVFDFRCRSFWDGGWHCLSLDIHRNDTMEDLFPSRGDNGVYWRLK